MNQNDQPRRPRRIEPWPLIVVAFLLLNIGICTVTIVASIRHPAIIEPNYYDKALRWDVLREIKDSAQEARLVVTAADSPGVLVVTLENASNHALRAQKMTAIAVHESMPEIKVPLVLQKNSEGVYESSVPLTKPGVWSVVATVTLDTSLEAYTFTSQITISP